MSREIVPEPHAFEISIVAQTANAPFTFSFSQEEGKVELSDAQIKAASIGIDTAGLQSIKSALQLPGEIRLNEDRTSHVVPRIAGVVESVQASLGQRSRRDRCSRHRQPCRVREQRSELQTAQSGWPWRDNFRARKRLWRRRFPPSRTTCKPAGH